MCCGNWNKLKIKKNNERLTSDDDVRFATAKFATYSQSVMGD